MTTSPAISPHVTMPDPDPDLQRLREEQDRRIARAYRDGWSTLGTRMDEARRAGLGELLDPVRDGIRQLAALAETANHAGRRGDRVKAAEARRAINRSVTVLRDIAAGTQAALNRALVPQLEVSGADRREVADDVELALAKVHSVDDAGKAVQRLIAEEGAGSQHAALLCGTWGRRWGEAHDLPGLADYAKNEVREQLAASGSDGQRTAARLVAAFDAHGVEAVVRTAGLLAVQQGDATADLARP